MTEDNILEYAKASSADGETDLTSAITYTTNYKEGTAGNYTVTYSVTDPENKTTTTRTVALVVRSTDIYKLNLSLDELRKPFASYLYHGKNSSSYQAQRAWDVALKEIKYWESYNTTFSDSLSGIAEIKWDIDEKDLENFKNPNLATLEVVDPQQFSQLLTFYKNSTYTLYVRDNAGNETVYVLNTILYQ